MAGRGDKNKVGSAGSGASNQSNQPFIPNSGDQHKTGYNKRHTGGKPSEPSPKTADPGAFRNEPLKESKHKQAE